MTRIKLLVVMALLVFAALCAWHAHGLVRARDALVAKHIGFMNIISTSSYSGDCGTFTMVRSDPDRLDSQRYYWGGNDLYTEDEIRAGRLARDPPRKPLRCEEGSDARWFAARADYLTVGRFGAAPRAPRTASAEPTTTDQVIDLVAKKVAR